MSSPSPLIIPVRVTDYAAGNPHRSHHQPKPFNTESHEDFPPLPNTDTNNKRKRKHEAGEHRCFYCGVMGHWNFDCRTPHFRCPLDDRCTVPLDHPFFDKACELGQCTATNNVAKTPAKKHKCRHHHKRQDTPAPIAGPSSAPRFEDNGLPPVDSLLFLPNPPTLASDAKLFRPSPYQVAPTLGIWRTGNWGEPWVSQPTPPLTLPSSTSVTTRTKTMRFSSPISTLISRTTPGSSMLRTTYQELFTITTMTPLHPPPPPWHSTKLIEESEIWESRAREGVMLRTRDLLLLQTDNFMADAEDCT
jgi:hypothetical protein